jgi:hypothetical protein
VGIIVKFFVLFLQTLKDQLQVMAWGLAMPSVCLSYSKKKTGAAPEKQAIVICPKYFDFIVLLSFNSLLCKKFIIKYIKYMKIYCIYGMSVSEIQAVR